MRPRAVLTACSPTPMPSDALGSASSAHAADLAAIAATLSSLPDPATAAAFGPVGARFLAALADAAADRGAGGGRVERQALRQPTPPRTPRPSATTTPTCAPAALIAGRLADAERPGGRAGGADPRGAVAGRPRMVGRSGADPASDAGQVRDALAEVSAAAGRAWRQAEPRLVGRRSRRCGRVHGGDDAAADRWRSPGVPTSWARRPPQRLRRWRGPTSGCTASSTASRPRAAALEPHLDSPGVAEELLAEAQRSLAEAVAVVEELQAELDGHAAALTGPAAPRHRATPRPGCSLDAVDGLRARRWRADEPAVRRERDVRLRAWRPRLAGAPTTTRPQCQRPAPSETAWRSGCPTAALAMAPNAVAASAVRHALTQLGVPYQWGGTTPGVGLDCSGLTQWAYREAGLESSAAGAGAGRRCARRPRFTAAGRPGGVGRPRGDDRRQRHDDRGGRSGEAVADPNRQRGSGFSGVLAADGVSCDGHGIASAQLHMPLEAQRCGHRAVAIPIVAVGGLVSARSGQQCA